MMDGQEVAWVNKTLNMVRQRYYWFQARNSVEKR
jgi:hypothetical protein